MIAGPRPRVAILPWGDAIEDFLDPLGVTLQGFRDEMSGGWLFNYVDALATAGIDAVVIVVARGVSRPVRWIHRATRAPLWVIPASRAFRALRSRPRVATLAATPLRALRRVLVAENCGAILCQEYEYARFDACAALGRLMGLPVMATYQGGDRTLTREQALLRRVSMRTAAGLVIGPEAEARRVAARYGVPRERIARIFNPLDRDAGTPGDRAAARRELGISPDEQVVAWHGRVSLEAKGLDVLADAWRRLGPQGPGGRPRRLLLVGTGPDAPRLRALLRPGEGAEVTWIDEYVLDRAKVRGWLSAADLYCFPSRHEGFPVAPVEALAAGLPLVAADAPGVREILPDGERSGGVVVACGDAPALAQEIDLLLSDDPRRERMSAAARHRAAEGFSLEAIGSQLAGFLTRRGLRARAPG